MHDLLLPVLHPPHVRSQLLPVLCPRQGLLEMSTQQIYTSPTQESEPSVRHISCSPRGCVAVRACAASASRPPPVLHAVPPKHTLRQTDVYAARGAPCVAGSGGYCVQVVAFMLAFMRTRLLRSAHAQWLCARAGVCSRPLHQGACACTGQVEASTHIMHIMQRAPVHCAPKHCSLCFLLPACAAPTVPSLAALLVRVLAPCPQRLLTSSCPAGVPVQARSGVGAHPQQWGDEFASQLAQGLNLGTDEELERAWRAQVEGAGGAARGAGGLSGRKGKGLRGS